jgi:hypothetical protein
MYGSPIQKLSRTTGSWPVAGHPWGSALPVGWRATDAYELLISRRAEDVMSAAPKITMPACAKRRRTCTRRGMGVAPSRRGGYLQIVVVCLEVPGCMLRRPVPFKKECTTVATSVTIQVGQARDRKPGNWGHLHTTTSTQPAKGFCLMVMKWLTHSKNPRREMEVPVAARFRPWFRNDQG